MQEIHCKSAIDFISYLRIGHELWGGQPNWDWGFRGQGNADWPLTPSAFRDGTMLSFADDARGPLSDLDEQHRREYKLIQHFLFLADRVGLSVPGDAQHFRLPPNKSVILDLLDREFYNRARSMPTHDNVVQALKFERVLNAHRRNQDILPAVTFGPKY